MNDAQLGIIAGLIGILGVLWFIIGLVFAFSGFTIFVERMLYIFAIPVLLITIILFRIWRKEK